MPYSTGRGGAGNIQESSNITSENNVISPATSRTNNTSSPPLENGGNKRIYYSTGRGGAGNIKSSSSLPSPKLVPQGSNTPQLHSEKITTGRGGYGNMIKNSDPELTRKLQDVDGATQKERENELYAVASNKSFSVGRGGFGNVMSQTKSRTSQNSGGTGDHQPALISISSQGKIREEDEYDEGNLHNGRKKKSFIGKLKGLFS
ncbi:hypothetical protein CAAN1_10S02608 [[Candida] anglica]|uniref:Protein PAR32 n=1 Tax=[Candida] anglica TaxID=148631 RepID=A0ABP0EGZ3_9ASCO